jgi:hypothetical protein
MTRAFEAKVLSHEGARDGAVDIVSPISHAGQKFVCDQRVTKKNGGVVGKGPSKLDGQSKQSSDG